MIENRLQKRTSHNLNKKASDRKNLRFRSGLYQEFFARLFWKTRRLQSCAINYINHYIPQNIDGGYLNGKIYLEITLIFFLVINFNNYYTFITHTHAYTHTHTHTHTHIVYRVSHF